MSAFTRWLCGLLAAAAIGIVVTGAWFYRIQQDYVRQDIEPDLETIAELKVNQIAEWRKERLGDAAVLSGSPFFAEEVAAWFADPRPDVTEALLVKFRSLQRSYGYSEVLLVDADGEVRLSEGSHSGRIQDAARRALLVALRDGKPVLTDLHRGDIDANPQMSAIAPILAGGGPARKPVGGIILVVDASSFLYPLIQSWPMKSETAESLLVRKNGGGVLFLNNLRYRQGTALKLAIPMTHTNVPAVMAVLGQTGVVYGVDYRGVSVVSVLRAVPNSPWFMVCKMDESEAFAAWRFRSILILSLVLWILFTTIALVAMIWQRREKRHYRALYKSEAARHGGEERYRVTLMSVGDAVIATDAEGRVDFVNAAAESLTGWKQEEARGKPLEVVFRIINEGTRQPVENPVERVVREGEVVGLGNHTVLIARDGREVAIADSGAPIRDENGVISGVVLVFRDVGKEQRYDRERETTLTLLRLLNDRNNTKELIRNITVYLQQWSGCEAVGIRLKDGDDYPYFETRGFPAKFVEAENFLCERDLDGQLRRDSLGNPCLECMCGNILCGRSDPSKSFFTAKGSFWSNCTTELLATTTPADRQGRTRNRCNGEGYESVALVRLQSGRETLGLLQFNDHAKGRFTPETLTFLENIADQIALALAERRAQAAVRRNEAILNETGSIARIGGWEHDLVTGKATWTKALYDIFESESGDPPGPNEHLSYYPPDDRARLSEAYQRGMETGAPFDLELQVFTAKKRLIWAEVIGRPITENGKCVRMVGTFQDITARKQAEHDIEASETRYRRLFETAKDGILILDADNGMIVDVNPFMVEMLGFPREECLGRQLWEIGPFRDTSAAGALFSDLRAREYVRYDDIPVKTRAGQTVEVEFVSNVYRVDNQRVIQCNIRNITERKKSDKEISRLLEQGDNDRKALLGILEDAKRAETALRENTVFLNTLLNAIPVPVFYKDTQGRYIGVNKAFEAFFGKTQEELVGKSVFDIAPRELAVVYHANDEELFQNPGVQVYDAQMKDAQGRLHDVVYHKATFTGADDQVRGLVGAIMDITDRKQAEEAISQSRDYLNRIINAIPDPIFVKDEQHRLVLVNDADCALAGLAREDRIGKTDHDFFPKEQVDEFWRKDDEVFATGRESVNEENITDARTGTVRTIITKKTLYTDVAGKRYIVGVIRDITDRKRAEEDLRFRNILLSTQQEVSIDGILVVDENARIVSYNQRFIEMWSVPPELVAQKVDEALLQFNTNQVADPQAFLERVQYLYEHHRATSQDEVVLKDGRIFDRYSAPMVGPDERYYGRVWYFRDISDRKRAEGELRRNYDIQKVTESLLRLSLDDVPLENSLARALELVLAIPWLSLESKGAVFVTGDKPGTLRMIAQRGLSDAVRERCDEVPFGHCLCGRAASRRTVQFCDRIDEDHEVRYPGMAPHGHYCVPILWGERVLGVLALYLREGHSRDEREVDFLRSVGDAIAGVVQLKSAEQEIRKLNEGLELKVRDRTAQLEAANKELEAFSYSVSHDLRAPLRAIDGFSQHLLEEFKDGLGAEGSQDLARVRAAAQRMSRLIDDMLGLSRLTRQEMKIGPVDLARIANDISSDLHKVEPAREVEFVVAPEAMANGDERLLALVMQNLLSNAWKFTRHCGKARIEFGVTTSVACRVSRVGQEHSTPDTQHPTPVFFVRDNGAGFDMAYAKKLFGAFQRLHSEQEFEGTGIGLAIVQRIIHRHGGSVWAESAVGKGTTFYFTI